MCTTSGKLEDNIPVTDNAHQTNFKGSFKDNPSEYDRYQGPQLMEMRKIVDTMLQLRVELELLLCE